MSPSFRRMGSSPATAAQHEPLAIPWNGIRRSTPGRTAGMILLECGVSATQGSSFFRKKKSAPRNRTARSRSESVSPLIVSPNGSWPAGTRGDGTPDSGRTAQCSRRSARRQVARDAPRVISRAKGRRLPTLRQGRESSHTRLRTNSTVFPTACMERDVGSQHLTARKDEPKTLAVENSIQEVTMTSNPSSRGFLLASLLAVLGLAACKTSSPTAPHGGGGGGGAATQFNLGPFGVGQSAQL